MKAKGRFGLIVPEINSPLDYDFVEGAYAQAKELGYDLIVYTGVFNSMRGVQYDAYIAGLENIYTLVCMHELDGIIYAYERFHTQEVIDKISDYVSQTDTPCFVLGGEVPKAQSMDADEYDSMYRITRHMTDEHGCRKLYCLAGVPEHKSSEARLRGFKNACADCGIVIEDKDVFYGWFWKDIPEKLGLDIASGKTERPDAVVCCNDVMAVTLIETLTENGIRVPEDIKVTGFDGEVDSLFCKLSLTTITGRDKQFGADAVCRLYGMINGTAPQEHQGIVNISENLIAAIEAGLRERFGDVRLPEFVTDITAVNTVESSAIEKLVHEAVQSLNDKKNASESNYIDYKEQIFRMRRNLISQPQKDRDIDSISREIGISRSHLQRLYKQIFGVTVKDDIISARIKRAMQLLTNTDMRIQEIAEQCGYNNESHFMRQFKEKCGMTAIQYRKQNK